MNLDCNAVITNGINLLITFTSKSKAIMHKYIIFFLVI